MNQETLPLTPSRQLDYTIARILYGPWDESKCRICGWPVYPDLSLGCILGNCSRRPLPIARADAPPRFSDPQRDADKAALLDAVLWLAERMPLGMGIESLFVVLFMSKQRPTLLTLPDVAMKIVRLVLHTAQVTTLDEVPL